MRHSNFTYKNADKSQYYGKTEKKEGVQPQYLYLMILNALPLFSSVFLSINSSAIPLFPGNQPQQSHHKAVQE